MKSTNQITWREFLEKLLTKVEKTQETMQGYLGLVMEGQAPALDLKRKGVATGAGARGHAEGLPDQSREAACPLGATETECPGPPLSPSLCQPSPGWVQQEAQPAVCVDWVPGEGRGDSEGQAAGGPAPVAGQGWEVVRQIASPVSHRPLHLCRLKDSWLQLLKQMARPTR